jgi:hypothetical protein
MFPTARVSQNGRMMANLFLPVTTPPAADLQIGTNVALTRMPVRFQISCQYHDSASRGR